MDALPPLSDASLTRFPKEIRPLPGAPTSRYPAPFAAADTAGGGIRPGDRQVRTAGGQAGTGRPGRYGRGRGTGRYGRPGTRPGNRHGQGRAHGTPGTAGDRHIGTAGDAAWPGARPGTGR